MYLGLWWDYIQLQVDYGSAKTVPHLTPGPSERSLTTWWFEGLLCIFCVSATVSPQVPSACLDLSFHKGWDTVPAASSSFLPPPHSPAR